MNANEYDFDLNEHVILLNDWFDETIINKFAFNHHGTTDNDKATGILINGKGVDMRKITEEIFHSPRAVFHVKYGFRYRFRLINSGVSYCPIQFMIDNHTISVIASDGHSVKSRNFEAIVLHAGIIDVNLTCIYIEVNNYTVLGERYDVVLNASKKEGNYWIKAKGLGDCDIEKVFQTAILNYDGVDEEDKPFGDEILDYDSIEVHGMVN